MRAIEVEYSYEPVGYGECVIDIGLFSPCSTRFLASGGCFRGWSGSNKKRFFLCRHQATPGYLPGEVGAGVWRVILGLYKVPEEGCRCRLRIRLRYNDCGHEAGEAGAHRPTVASSPSKPINPRGTGLYWVSGDLHVHSNHSDGDTSVDGVLEKARSMGLDFISVTDHNTTSHLAGLGGGMVVPGEEVTTYKGHMNVLGVRSWVDFRVRSNNGLRRLLEYLRRRGLLAYPTHPRKPGVGWEWGSLMGFDAIEVWNGAWWSLNYEALGEWEKTVSSGLRVVALGGSDAHQVTRAIDRANTLGTPTVHVLVKDQSPSEIIRGLRAGRVVLTEGPGGPMIEFSVVDGRGRAASVGGEVDLSLSREVKAMARVAGAPAELSLRVITAEGVVRTTRVPPGASSHVFKLKLSGGDVFLRADIVGGGGDLFDTTARSLDLKAMTNPIYIKRWGRSPPSPKRQTL